MLVLFLSEESSLLARDVSQLTESQANLAKSLSEAKSAHEQKLKEASKALAEVLEISIFFLFFYV